MQGRFRVEGELAVITGGGRGIGLACAEALGEAGARLVIIEPTDEAGASGREHLAAKGFEVEAVTGDVTNSARMTEIADDLADRGRAATILVNNAGIGETGTASQDMPDALWLRVMDVNVNGLFWCSRAFGRHMIKARRGAIVNLGSISGLIVNRPQAQTPYNVSKAAVHHITHCLAAEWAPHGIRVNAVAPTYIDTPMVHANPAIKERLGEWMRDTPMGRMGQPSEIASAVLFLASDAASLMTGTVVPVDGGYTIW